MMDVVGLHFGIVSLSWVYDSSKILQDIKRISWYIGVSCGDFSSKSTACLYFIHII